MLWWKSEIQGLQNGSEADLYPGTKVASERQFRLDGKAGGFCRRVLTTRDRQLTGAEPEAPHPVVHRGIWLRHENRSTENSRENLGCLCRHRGDCLAGTEPRSNLGGIRRAPWRAGSYRLAAFRRIAGEQRQDRQCDPLSRVSRAEAGNRPRSPTRCGSPLIPCAVIGC